VSIGPFVRLVFLNAYSGGEKGEGKIREEKKGKGEGGWAIVLEHSVLFPSPLTRPTSAEKMGEKGGGKKSWRKKVRGGELALISSTCVPGKAKRGKEREKGHPGGRGKEKRIMFLSDCPPFCREVGGERGKERNAKKIKGKGKGSPDAS